MGELTTIKLKRPRPPKSLTQNLYGVFEPARTVEAWMRTTFLSSASPFYNPDHEHLNAAEIGILWTNVVNKRQMRRVAGEARLAQPQAKGAWPRAREEMQLRQWFGNDRELNFIITLDAIVCRDIPDVEFYALIDHELYHCAQAVDEYGAPRFSRQTGLPIFAIRGHDVEEFIGVARRWGPISPDVRALVDAASQPPLTSVANISRLCGVAA